MSQNFLDEDLFLEPISEDYPSFETANNWFDKAYEALLEYISINHKAEFTMEEFRNWLTYYTDLPDPPSSVILGHVFQKAFMKRFIRTATNIRDAEGRPRKAWIAR